MAKKIQSYIKLTVKAGQANPSPPVGPALGQHGLNIMDFCKQFNDKSKDNKPGTPLPVVITVYNDRSFSFIVKTPPASYLIKEILGLKKGSSNPNTDKIGKISRAQLEEVAQIKMADLNAASLDAAVNIIAGSARSMGVEVEGA